MGFGWLFLGYIVSFVLYSVAKLLSAGFAAHLTGYLLMLRGLWELRRYRKEFLLPLGGVALQRQLHQVTDARSDRRRSFTP